MAMRIHDINTTKLYWNNRLYTYWLISNRSARTHDLVINRIYYLLKILDDDKFSERITRHFTDILWTITGEDLDWGSIIIELTKRPWQSTHDINRFIHRIQSGRAQYIINSLRKYCYIDSFMMPNSKYGTKYYGASFLTLRLINDLVTAPDENVPEFFSYRPSDHITNKDIALLFVKDNNNNVCIIKHENSEDVIPPLRNRYSLPYLYIPKITDIVPEHFWNFKRNSIRETRNLIKECLDISDGILRGPDMWIPPNEPGKFAKVVFTIQTDDNDNVINQLEQYINERIRMTREGNECIISKYNINELWNKIKKGGYNNLFHDGSLIALSFMYQQLNNIDNNNNEWKNVGITLSRHITDSLKILNYANDPYNTNPTKRFYEPLSEQFVVPNAYRFYYSIRNEDPLVSYVHIPTIRALLNYPTGIRDKTILDLGCGNGWLVFKFATYAKTIVGIDINEDIIESAIHAKNRQGIRNIEFIKGDIRKLDEYIGDRKFDIVTAISLLFYFEDSNDLINIINNVYRHLNDYGKFLAFIINPAIRNNSILFGRRIRRNNDNITIEFLDHRNITTHFRSKAILRSLDEYIQLFKNAGFTTQTSIPIVNKAVGNDNINAFNSNPLYFAITGIKNGN